MWVLFVAYFVVDFKPEDTFTRKVFVDKKCWPLFRLSMSSAYVFLFSDDVSNALDRGGNKWKPRLTIHMPKVFSSLYTNQRTTGLSATAIAREPDLTPEYPVCARKQEDLSLPERDAE